jgi:tellurite resistance-related uncharacterized protein
MQRAITGFHRDAEDEWVAELACGHGQHTRHAPPFQERAWVTTEAGRAAKIGSALACLRCDRRELPDGYAPYRRTPMFDAGSLPDALRKDHTTKRGVWALIHVARGTLGYRVGAPYHTHETLAAGAAPGVVLPEVEHCVEPHGDVQFQVEFWGPPR